MTTLDQQNCENMLQNILELQSTKAHFNAKQYKQLANYLRSDAIDKPSFEYRLQRAYGGFAFDRMVTIVNAEFEVTKPQLIKND